MADKLELWKVTVWFPSHCGSDPQSLDRYYAAESMDAALLASRNEYSHGTITGAVYIAPVSIVGGSAPAGKEE